MNATFLSGTKYNFFTHQSILYRNRSMNLSRCTAYMQVGFCMDEIIQPSDDVDGRGGGERGRGKRVSVTDLWRSPQ